MSHSNARKRARKRRVQGLIAHMRAQTELPEVRQAIELACLLTRWERQGGPKLTRRLESLVQANQRSSVARQCAKDCAFLGQAGRDLLVNKHEEGVLVERMEFIQVVQSRFGSLQFERTRTVYSRQNENYRFYETTTRQLIAWLERSLIQLESGALEARVAALEARYGRVEARRDTRTVIRSAEAVEALECHLPLPQKRHTAAQEGGKWVVRDESGSQIGNGRSLQEAASASGVDIRLISVAR